MSQPMTRVQMVTAALMAAVVTVCGSARPRPQDNATPRLSSRYFPLKVGDRWLYEDAYFKRTQRMEVSVARQVDPHTFVVQMKPHDVPLPKGERPSEVRMEIRPRGIFDGARYVLEEPLQPGKKWMAILNATTAERFEVVTMDAAADVPAGKFSDCLQVRSTIRAPRQEQQVTDVTYCPDVGMVERRVSVTKPGKPTITVWHGRLLYYETQGARIYPKKLGE
jgi:hypothetical protein